MGNGFLLSNNVCILTNMSQPKPKQRTKYIKPSTTGIDGMTLHEVGDVFSVTRERIRQIEAKAMRSLRAKLRKRGIYKTEDLL